MYRNCQVCGNPLFSMNDYGTDMDGRLNRDYCSNCYKTGHFYNRDWDADSDDPMPAPYARLFGSRTDTGTPMNGNGLF